MSFIISLYFVIYYFVIYVYYFYIWTHIILVIICYIIYSYTIIICYYSYIQSLWDKNPWYIIMSLYPMAWSHDTPKFDLLDDLKFHRFDKVCWYKTILWFFILKKGAWKRGVRIWYSKYYYITLKANEKWLKWQMT